jgi:hypothetical protein
MFLKHTQERDKKKYSLKMAWIFYFQLLLSWILIAASGMIFITFNLPIIGFIFYLTAFIFYFWAGYLLNKKVLPNLVEWHLMYDTIFNVSSGKIRILITWPLSYPHIFFRLMMIKII